MSELIFIVSIAAYFVFGFFFWRWALKRALVEDGAIDSFFCIGYWPVVIFFELFTRAMDAVLNAIVEYEIKQKKG